MEVHLLKVSSVFDLSFLLLNFILFSYKSEKNPDNLQEGKQNNAFHF